MADLIKALLGFTKMSAVDLRTFAQRIYTSMKDNPAYPKPPVSMEELYERQLAADVSAYEED